MRLRHRPDDMSDDYIRTIVLVVAGIAVGFMIAVVLYVRGGR